MSHKICPFSCNICGPECALYISEEHVCTFKGLYLAFENHLPIWLARIR